MDLMDGLDGWMDGLIGWMDWMDGWMDGLDGWMDGWIEYDKHNVPFSDPDTNPRPLQFLSVALIKSYN